MFNTSLLVALPLVSGFWLIVGAVTPWFVPKGPNRGTIRIMIITVAICCYSFWLIAFLAQLNPLFGPEVSNAVAGHMRRVWLGWSANITQRYPCYPSW